MNTDFFAGLIKNKNNRLLYIIFIIGIVLMLLSGVKSNTPAVQNVYSEQEELTRIISGIEGAGKAEVMVTYYGTGTSNIVYDTKIRGEETDRKAVVSDGEAVIAGASYPRVKGVVVVAKGADSEQICSKIRKAVMVALDVPEYKVAVLCGN